MIDSKELDKMSQIEITEIDPSTLVDISTIELDMTLPQAERMEQYIEQVHNPYCFLSGSTPVRIRFAETEKTLSHSLQDYFTRLKQR